VIAIRADGDAAVGLGHVRRCLALAEALAPTFRVRFLLRGTEEVAGLVRREGFSCDLVPGGAAATLAAVEAAGAASLVLDSYEVAPRDCAVVHSGGWLLVVLDDTGRYPIPADLVVNPAPGAGATPADNGARYLLGPRFALLRREFATPVGREIRGTVRRLLLILGGATPAPLMVTLARAARRALPDATVDVVVGPAGDGPAAVAAGLAGADGVEIHAAPGSVRPLMIEADLAITGGGVTVFELAAAGTPAIGVELAPNQRPNLLGMAEAGTLLVAGRGTEAGLDEAVSRALEDLAPDAERRRAMSRRGRELVDGRGAARVAEAIRAGLEELRPVVGRLA
jgi:spore coat polysaccharide biosynthesis predicted glycosyltransferase SpsG